MLKYSKFRTLQIWLLWPAVIFLLLVLSAPFILERLILYQMSRHGILDPRVTVDILRPNRISLSGLGGANLGLEIQSLAVHFSLQSLFRGQADLIEVSGLEWRLVWTGGQVDPGLPLTADAHAGNAAALPLPPVNRLQLHSSYLFFQKGSFSWTLPLDMELSLTDSKYLEGFLHTKLLGLPLVFNGQGDLQAGSLRIQGSFPGYIHNLKQVRQEGFALQGGLDFVWTQILEGAGQGEFALSLSTQGQGCQRFDLGLEQGVFHLAAKMDQNLQIHEFQSELKLQGVRVQEYLLSRLDLQLKEVGGHLDLHCRLEEPAELELFLQGEQTDLNALLEQGFTWAGQWTYDLQGELPGDLVSQLAGTTEIQTRDLPLQATGRLNSMISRNADSWDWHMQLEANNTRLGPLDLTLEETDLHLDGLLLQGPVLLRADNHGLDIKAAADSSLGLQSGKLLHTSEKFELSALALSAPGNRPWLEYYFKWGGEQKISLDARLKQQLSLVSEVLQFKVPRIHLKGDLARAAKHDWQGVLRLVLDQGQMALPAENLRLESIAMDLPLVLGPEEQQSGEFQIKRIHQGPTSWPGPQGQILALEEQLQLQGAWQFLPGFGLQLDLELALVEGKGLNGQFRVWSDWLDLSQGQELAAFIPELQDLELTGLARLDVQARLAANELQPYLELELSEVQIKMHDPEFRLQGLSGKIALDSLSPLQTARNQDTYIAFSELEWDFLQLEQGRFQARLQNAQFLLDSGSCILLPEGEVALYQGRWDLNRQEGAVRVFLQEVDPLQILSDLTQGKIEGRGLFSGSFALGFGQEGLLLRGGHLYSLPGTGRLGIKDEEWLEALLFYVRESLAGHEYLSLLSQRLEQALRDFEYDFFSLRLLPQAGDVAAQIELRGQGVQGDPPQKVGSLVLNINDVQEALNQTLRFNLGQGEVLQKALEDLF